jgi:predicted metal-dependent TIM-barrel fold hydrolase
MHFLNAEEGDTTVHSYQPTLMSSPVTRYIAPNIETPQAQPQQVVIDTVTADTVMLPRSYRITVQSEETAYEDACEVIKVSDDGAYASFVIEQRTMIPSSKDYAPTNMP